LRASLTGRARSGAPSLECDRIVCVTSAVWSQVVRHKVDSISLQRGRLSRARTPLQPFNFFALPAIPTGNPKFSLAAISPS
jgi:hypothetical protein